FITAGGNLRLFEIADSIEAYGDRLFFDRAGGEATIVSDAARQPRLVHLASGGASPFVVHADTLKLWTSDRTGEAFGNVRFTRGNIWGSCGRAHLMMPEDQLLLVESPQVEDPDGWVAGDSMVVHLRDGRADKLVVWGRARSEYIPAERSGEVHFSQGDSLSAFMDAGEIQSVLIEGDAQALYLPSWLDAQRGIGLNWTRGNRMRIIMRDSGVRRVQFEGQVQGNYALPLSPGESDARAAAQRMSPLAYIRSCLGSETLQPTDSLLRVLEFNPEEVVEYEGDQIDFEVVTDQVMISGRAHMVYGDIQLFGEEIAFDASRDLITARGEPVLRDKDSEVHGTEMTYRIDNKKGLVFQGRSEFEGGYYRGERVKRVGKKVYFAQDGDFTTCEHDPPHFHFHAKKMKIVTGEKIFASPVVLYLGNVPVLPIPYAILPSRSGRQSGILIPEIEFGFDTNRGRFLRNIGYYYAPNDYMDGLFWLDYYEKNPRVTLNARARYRVRYLLSGGVDGSFTSEDVRGGGKRDRWLLNVNHNQTLGERFNLKVSGRFQSDKDYGADRDFGADVDERINRVLRSQMSLSKSWSGASMTLAADRTEYLDDSGGATKISQSIPSVNIALNSLPLGVQPDDRGRGGRLAFLSSTYLRAGMKFRSPYTETWGEGKVTTNQAAGLNASLSDKRRLLGRVNVTPSIRMSTAWARKDKDEQQQGGEGKKNCVGIVWQAGLSANSALYGTFFPRLGPWEGLRHVAEFSASYNYRPEIDHVENFPSVGGISLSSSKASSVSLGMTQRFHLKFSSGEETFKKENLIILSSRTSYDFLAKQKDREPWADLAHSLRLQPGKLLSSELSLTHDVKTWSRSRFQARTTLRMQGGGNRSGAVGGAAEEAPQHGG
ncbi:MAG: LPS assembly protein LptD, partial [Candidatus Eisenbacteria sp.]|nr:LPS assembly protein LptD [Candidatus Eisenbacteria bacterium]